MARFKEIYNCFPLSIAGKHHLEKGDKIIMPPSALLLLSTMESTQHPMLFQLGNPCARKVSHCGVFEFTAPEGTAFLPAWIMQKMRLLEGDPVVVKSASLENATYMKLRPHKTAFVELSDPKAVLEKTLREFSCLGPDDTIVIDYDDKKFSIDVLETKPGNKAVSIIDTDCEVDFAPPLDYKESEKPVAVAPAKVEKAKDGAEKMKMKEGGGLKEEVKFRVFGGAWKRLDGTSGSSESTNKASTSSGRTSVAKKENYVVKEQENGFKPFTGKSYRLSD